MPLILVIKPCVGPCVCHWLPTHISTPTVFVSVPRYWSRIDGLIREALILRKVHVRLLISCWENTQPLTFNFVWSLRSLCMEQANCSLEAVGAGQPLFSVFISVLPAFTLLSLIILSVVCVQKFFNPRVLRDGSFQGINFNRFMVTDRAIYLGERIDFLVFLFKILFFKGKTCSYWSAQKIF